MVPRPFSEPKFGRAKCSVYLSKAAVLSQSDCPRMECIDGTHEREIIRSGPSLSLPRACG